MMVRIVMMVMLMAVEVAVVEVVAVVSWSGGVRSSGSGWWVLLLMVIRIPLSNRGDGTSAESLQHASFRAYQSQTGQHMSRRRIRVAIPPCPSPLSCCRMRPSGGRKEGCFRAFSPLSSVSIFELLGLLPAWPHPCGPFVLPAWHERRRTRVVV